MRHARLARISSWRRRSRQVTPQPVEDNVFGPNLNQVKRQLVLSPVPAAAALTPGAGARRPRGTLDAGHGSGSGKTTFRVRETTTRRKSFWIRSPLVSWLVSFFLRGAQRLGPSMFPSTAPETRLQDCLACKPCTGYGLGQRLGRYSRGAIPDRIGTKTNIACLHRLRRPKGWAGG